MFHVILYQPEIPPNTGNVIRLCANTGSKLHLIEPLGFEPDDRQLRRAGLDYGDWSRVRRHPDLAACLRKSEIRCLYTLSTHHERLYTDAAYRAGDGFIFGPETRGLPVTIRESVPPDRRITLPMRPDNRSLNLANSVAVVVYEAWHQLGFANNRGAP
ncbi:MAG: tRNA (cytidine(34)-2'-O)-methyltransferase [Gammaproteobacteria bacterium]|nr:tRNA (cytidine(34)-2'-O)-methyltransferase [Gammaproteobacteria bacterium]